MNTLRIENLSHRFGVTEVLHGITLELAAGETLALVGPSGCGKSTLLRIAAGLLVPAEGEVHNPFRGSACVFQQPRLMPWKTALDNVALGLKALGLPRAARRRQAHALALQLGLQEDDLRKYPHELSGGMQSRVSLARALVLAPDLLLLDEPFASLDVGLKQALYAVLRAQVAARGCAMLMITHDLIEAVRLADRICLMAGTPGQMVHQYRLRQPFEARDEDWVHATTGRLVQRPEVRAAFGLPALAMAEAAPAETAVQEAFAAPPLPPHPAHPGGCGDLFRP